MVNNQSLALSNSVMLTDHVAGGQTREGMVELGREICSAIAALRGQYKKALVWMLEIFADVTTVNGKVK